MRPLAATLALSLALPLPALAECRDEPPAESGSRSLSDAPYADHAEPCRSTFRSDAEHERPNRNQNLEGGLDAREETWRPLQRVGFGALGGGAVLIITAGGMFACSRLVPLDQGKAVCSALWPWELGAGIALMGVGTGILVYDSGPHTQAPVAQSPRTVMFGRSFAFDLGPRLR
jgi:hypothetical protein